MCCMKGMNVLHELPEHILAKLCSSSMSGAPNIIRGSVYVAGHRSIQIPARSVTVIQAYGRQFEEQVLLEPAHNRNKHR